MRKAFTLLLFFISISAFSQRLMENLDRGLLAQKVSKGVYVNWRITGQEWYGTSYNLYRDGTKVNSAPITGASNVTDTEGTTSSTYTVTAIGRDGKESAPCKTASVLTKNYREIPLVDLGVTGYEPNDATVADLDGDGEMEIIIKRLYPDWSPSAAYFSRLEAYKLNGTLLWAINVGPNIISDVEDNVAAFDFDGDGKAEVFMRSSEGTIFGDGTQIGDTDNDGITNYRSYSWGGTDGTYPNYSTYLCKGPEFLSLIDGETGKELDRVDYIPRTFDGRTMEDIWGDSYGHRANKFFFGAPYLDGKKPSLFISRGIYTRIVMRTYDVVNKKLKFKWEFNTDSNPAYAYQGNHNYTIADADGDGCDEIIYASMTVDHNGKGLYSTGLGHGDALHVSDFDPYQKGLEVWACHEHEPYGTSFRDAATGEIFIRHSTSGDCGRCAAANVTNNFLGAELWGGGQMYSAVTREATPGATSGGSENFPIYWDGDLLQETFNYVSTNNIEGNVWKYGVGNLMTTSGAATCNGTKGTPCMQVDLYGDWREELIMRSSDNNSLRIYTTQTPTENRIYTLLHDMQYRQAICWQMCGYNQPPHVSYFLGERENILLPPPPVMSNDRYVHNGSNSWTPSSFTYNESPATYSDGSEVLFDQTGTQTVTLSGAVAPSILFVNNTTGASYTFTGGSINGTTELKKQGYGSLTLNSTLNYTGTTELWNGLTILNSDLSASPILMKRFSELELHASAAKGITQEYGSILRVGANNEKATVTVGDSLVMQAGSEWDADIYDTDFSSDLLKINGDLTIAEGAVLRITPHASGSAILPGEYTVAEVTGEINGSLLNVVIKGLDGIAASLSAKDGKIILTISNTRAATTVTWDGANDSGLWDLAKTKNFLNNSESDLFVTGDHITFNDNATSKTVNIGSSVMPASVTVDNTQAYTFSGDGAITGDGTFTKNGTGLVTINNTNSFTGKVELNAGTVAASSMANPYGNGALGGLRTKAAQFVINGATLRGTGTALSSSEPMTIGDNGATFNTAYGNITLSGALVGKGVLTKSGTGSLILSATNTNTGGIVLNTGTLSMGTWNARFGSAGSTIELGNGTTVGIFNSDNTSAIPYFNYAVNITTGKTASLTGGNRCVVAGSLAGEGTINFYSPYVRCDFQANCSNLTGTLNVTGVNFRLNQGTDFSNATVSLGSGLTMGHYTQGSASAFSATTKIGALTGVSGSTLTSGVYNIGYNSKDATFDGTLGSVTINKYGDGVWTLTGTANTCSSVTVNAGTLKLTNVSGTAVGSGIVSVKDGGTLSLSKCTSTSMGSIIVYSGGIVQSPIASTINSRITLKSNAMLITGTTAIPVTFSVGSISAESGSTVHFDLRNISRYDKLLTTNGNVTFTTGSILKVDYYQNYVPVVGDAFVLISPAPKGTEPMYIFQDLPAGFGWDTSTFMTDGTIRVCAQGVGINQVAWANEVKAYPTPAESELYVTLPEAALGQEGITLTITNMEGKTLLRQSAESGSTTQTMIVSSLTTGNYLLIIETPQGKAIQRIVKK